MQKSEILTSSAGEVVPRLVPVPQIPSQCKGTSIQVQHPWSRCHSELMRLFGSRWQATFALCFFSKLSETREESCVSPPPPQPEAWMHHFLPPLFIFCNSPPWEPWEPWLPRYQRQVPLLFWQSQPGSGGVLEERHTGFDSEQLLPPQPSSQPTCAEDSPLHLPRFAELAQRASLGLRSGASD